MHLPVFNLQQLIKGVYWMQCGSYLHICISSNDPNYFKDWKSGARPAGPYRLLSRNLEYEQGSLGFLVAKASASKTLDHLYEAVQTPIAFYCPLWSCNGLITGLGWWEVSLKVVFNEWEILANSLFKWIHNAHTTPQWFRLVDLTNLDQFG